MVVLGQITSPFGIKGWIKIYSHTAERTSIFDYEQWYLQPLNSYIIIDEWKQQGKNLIAHIEGVDDRDIALSYCGNDILVDDNQLAKLDEGEYYWYQLEGLSVYIQPADSAKQLVCLGVVSQLIETGSNDVLVVNANSESIDQRQRLIPWLPDSIIIDVDLGNSKIIVDWDADF